MITCIANAFRSRGTQRITERLLLTFFQVTNYYDRWLASGCTPLVERIYRKVNLLCVFTCTHEECFNGIDDGAQLVFEPLHVDYLFVGLPEGSSGKLYLSKEKLCCFIVCQSISPFLRTNYLLPLNSIYVLILAKCVQRMTDILFCSFTQVRIHHDEQLWQ